MTAARAARAQRLAALFLAGAFVAGATVGLAADRVVGRRAAPTPAAAPSPALDGFAAELALTPAQRAAVDSILDERHRIIDSIVAPVRPQIEAARQSARQQIRQRLTDGQRARFERYLARMEDGRVGH